MWLVAFSTRLRLALVSSRCLLMWLVSRSTNRSHNPLVGGSNPPSPKIQEFKVRSRRSPFFIVSESACRVARALFAGDQISRPSLSIQILFRNIILRHLMRANLPRIGILGVFNPGHHGGLERVSFLKQLDNTLRICTFDAGQALQIS